MATATRQQRVTTPIPEPMEFRIRLDNGGKYRWSLVRPDGELLARSVQFPSSEAAYEAASHIRDGMAAATVEAGPTR